MIIPDDSIFDFDAHAATRRNTRINIFLTMSIVFDLLFLFSFDINLGNVSRMGAFDFFVLLLMLGIPVAIAILVYKRKKTGWITGFLFYEFIMFITSVSIIRQLIRSKMIDPGQNLSTWTEALFITGSLLLVLLLLPEIRNGLQVSQKTFIRTAVVVTGVNVVFVTFLFFANA